MGISLIHAGLAAGAALAAIPVIIHLTMRQTPKRIVFPALRLLQERQKRSTKRLRVKNWLLLLARMAVVALMALALARPTINAKVPLGDGEVPSAVALVVDTSLSMGYIDRGESRLDEAKKLGEQILQRLPESSEVYVIESVEPVAPDTPFSPSAAQARLQSIKLQPVARPLNLAIEAAYQALEKSREDLARLEVYVLTDLARSAWDQGSPLTGRLESVEEAGRSIATYVIRLAADEISDAAIVGLEARPETADPEGRRSFEVVATVANTGPASTRLLEFIVRSEEGEDRKRDQREVQLPENGQVEVTFKTPSSLEPGFHQASVLLDGEDPLEIDNQRFVTFESSRALDALILYERDPDNPEFPSIDASFVASAVDPEGSGISNRVQTRATDQIGDRFTFDLNQFDAIFLNNVGKLSDQAWNQLAEYLKTGGGIVIGLGRNSTPEHYNTAAAQQVVPGTVGEPISPEGATTFAEITDAAHPLFSPYAEAFQTDLASRPVKTYRSFEPSEELRVQTLVRFGDGAPAFLESIQSGDRLGRVLLWTTPLSRRPLPSDPDAWNEFPSVRSDYSGWSFVVLMIRSVPYLSGASSSLVNFEAGASVLLTFDQTQRPGSYFLQAPRKGLSLPINPDRGQTEQLLDAPEIGHYQIREEGSLDAEEGNGIYFGFSINPAPGESDFNPIDEEQLDRLFGEEEGVYALVDSPNEIERVQSGVRVGREVFPWLILLILVLLTAENYLANRFYRERGGVSPPKTVTASAA